MNNFIPSGMNNVFQQPMQQQYIPQQFNQQQMPPVQQEYFIGINGEAAASNYPIAPGSTVWMIDAPNKTVYLRVRDFQGIAQEPKVYDLVERVTVTAEPQTDVTSLQNEVQALKEQLASIIPVIEELKS